MKISNLLIILLVLINSVGLLNAQVKGEKKMKIAIIYSSKTGSTLEIVQFMKTVLEKKNAIVEIKKASDSIQLKSYQAIMIGSPIYMGRWNKEATSFIEKNQAELKNMPIAYFSVGMSFDKKDAKSLEQIEKYLEKERSLVKPLSEGRFMGRMDFSKLNFFQRMISKMVGAKEEDKRNWKAIQLWSEEFLENVSK